MGLGANIENVMRASKAFYEDDHETLLAILAPDIVWHFPGSGPLSGDYRGPDSVLDLFRLAKELSGDTIRLEPIDVMADDRHLMLIVRVTAWRGDESLDVVYAQAIKVGPDGRWTEYWQLADNQAAEDEFWSRVWPLAGERGTT